MTEARPLYSYSPLPSPTHIRVIALKPSSTTNAALRCSIRHVNLDDYLGNYEAISYTWGRPVFDHSLRCADGTRFAITANLHAALQSFRNIASTRLLWADAICINQNDSKEKNIQIKLMRRVYRTAHRVLVWLGSGVEDIEDTMNCLLLVTKVPFAALTGTSVKGREVSSVAKVNEPTVFIDTQKKRQLQIKRFLNLDWFSRRWIIQEVVLNSDVCLNYGQSDISWVRFMHAFQILGDVELLMEVEVPIQRSLSIMFELWQAHSLKRSVTSIERRDILSLLEAFHHFDCFDGRDRLFALAALVEDTEISGKTADDNPSLGYIDYTATVEQVYTTWASEAILSNLYEILALAGTFRVEKGRSSVPSWVPDWREPKRHVNLRKVPVPVYEESWEEDVRVAKVIGNALQLEFCVEKNWRGGTANLFSDITDVQRVFPAWPSDDDQSVHGAEMVEDILREALRLRPTMSVYEKDSTLQALCALVIESTMIRFHPGDFGGAGHMKSVLSDRLGQRSPISELDYRLGEVYRNFSDVMKGRRIFFHFHGREESSTFAYYPFQVYAGIGPSDTEVGDVFLCVEDSNYSFVLRPVTERVTPIHQPNQTSVKHIKPLNESVEATFERVVEKSNKSATHPRSYRLIGDALFSERRRSPGVGAEWEWVPIKIV